MLRATPHHAHRCYLYLTDLYKSGGRVPIAQQYDNAFFGTRVPSCLDRPGEMPPLRSRLRGLTSDAAANIAPAPIPQ